MRLTLQAVLRGLLASMVLLGALAVAGPAAAAPSLDLLAFTVRSGSMSEVMTFQGDGGPACAQAGVCGYSGTISYGFSAIRDGDGSVIITGSGRHSRAFGYASLSIGGLTTASVSGPGGGQPCTEKVLHRFDYVYVVGNARRLTLQFHPANVLPDYLESFCTAPSDADVGFAGALPTISIKTKDLNKRRLTLATSSVRQFHTGPFVGTVSFSVNLVLAHQKLSDFPLTDVSLGAGARRAPARARR
jgi:hypothetical protein